MVRRYFTPGEWADSSIRDSVDDLPDVALTHRSRCSGEDIGSYLLPGEESDNGYSPCSRRVPPQ